MSERLTPEELAWMRVEADAGAKRLIAEIDALREEIERLRKVIEWTLSGFQLDDDVEEELRAAIAPKGGE